jgi:hypothetical protein
MQMKTVQTTLVTTLIGFLLVGAFLVGTQLKSRQQDVVSYRVGNSTVAFARRDPLEGLSALQYVDLLKLIRKGDTNLAIAKLETILDWNINSAKHRRPLLDEIGLKALDQALSTVADYRSKFPRPTAVKPHNKNADIADWSRQVAEVNREFEREIDTFLTSFTSTNRSK